MFTLPRFEQALTRLLCGVPPAPRLGLCVALSGGLDSTALLAALAMLGRNGAERWHLRAIHVDHALHADSAEWARACRRLAASWSVPFEELRVDATAGPGESPEAAARHARYAALAARLAPGEVLLTAHHADDQLETILLQWLRGGGLRSVAGMASLAPFAGDAWHARPLLGYTRSELATWAGAQGLAWLEDPSNLDPRFDRNYLRLAVLPALRSRWPAAARTAARIAGYARDALELEADVARQDFAGVQHGQALGLAALAALPGPRQRSVLRLWLAGLGLPPPPERTLAALLRDVSIAGVDRIPNVNWPGAIVRRYRGCLYGDPAAAVATRPGAWNVAEAALYQWSDTSRLELVPDTGAGLSRARLPRSLEVRARIGGEQFRAAGTAHRRDLRKWLQEHDVLPWCRAGLPLVFAGAQLVAVADLAVCDEFAAHAGEPSWRLAWRRQGAVTAAEVAASGWPREAPMG